MMLPRFRVRGLDAGALKPVGPAIVAAGCDRIEVSYFCRSSPRTSMSAVDDGI